MFNGVFLTNVLSSIFIFGTAMSISVINSIDFTFVFMNFLYRNRMHNLYVYATTNKDTLHEYKIETPPHLQYCRNLSSATENIACKIDVC